MTTIIAKNPGGVDVGIEDFGLIIKAGEQRNLTEDFSLGDITDSQELKTKVQAGDLVINNGSSDLSIPDALDHLDVETSFEDKEQDATLPGGADRNIDGGRADSVYLPEQNFDGGSASG